MLQKFVRAAFIKLNTNRCLSVDGKCLKQIGTPCSYHIYGKEKKYPDD